MVLWKHIGRGWGTFSRHTSLEVGDGFRIKLWHDLWVGDKVLNVAYPEICGIAWMQEA